MYLRSATRACGKVYLHVYVPHFLGYQFLQSISKGEKKLFLMATIFEFIKHELFFSMLVDHWEYWVFYVQLKMKEIPFRFVGYEVWTQLANKLDPDTGLIGNNWRMLAEKLGYSTEVILVSQRETRVLHRSYTGNSDDFFPIFCGIPLIWIRIRY